MIIKELKLRDYPYKERRGLAERLAKRHFERQGYEVFRGRAIMGRRFSRYCGYENVKRKYARFNGILRDFLGPDLVLLRKRLGTGKGIPDLFVYRRFGEREELTFVEVKLEHESVRKQQLLCMRLLKRFGFDTMVLRLKRSPYREKLWMRLDGDLDENRRLKNKKVLARQERLWKRYEQ